MERIFSRLFFTVFLCRYPGCELGRAGKAAPVRDAEPVLCWAVGIYGIGQQRLFSVFAKAQDESFWYDGIVCLHKVWNFCFARCNGLVCIFAWVFVCQCARMYEISGDAAGTAVFFSAGSAVCSGLFWDRQDFIRDKDRGHASYGNTKAMEESETVFAVVRDALHACRDLDGGVCEPAFADPLYSQDVKKRMK